MIQAKKKIFIFSVIFYNCFAQSNLLPANNINNTSNNTNLPNNVYNSDGKFTGSSISNNGVNSYYSNRQYQGQSNTGSSFYYNKQGNLQLINQTP